MAQLAIPNKVRCRSISNIEPHVLLLDGPPFMQCMQKLKDRTKRGQLYTRQACSEYGSLPEGPTTDLLLIDIAGTSMRCGRGSESRTTAL
jgi:hypothetical protein